MLLCVQILEYIDVAGASPYRDWFESLNAPAAAKVTVALTRIEIDFGPGYRVYFGRDGDRLVILLAGGTKSRQQRDIVTAQLRWSDYKARKRS